MRTLRTLIVVVAGLAVLGSVALADEVYANKSKGVVNLVVIADVGGRETASMAPISAVILTLERGKFQSVGWPAEWTGTFSGGSAVWSTVYAPIFDGDSLWGLWLKAGGAKAATWATLDAAGNQLDSGTVSFTDR